VILGVSANDMETHLRFRTKHKLPFELLVDADATISKQYGVWKQKNLYGKKFMGIERTTFVIDKTGRIAQIYPKVKVEGTSPRCWRSSPRTDAFGARAAARRHGPGVAHQRMDQAPRRPVPVFPLPGVVLFPGAEMRLHVFELRYRTMVRDALSGERLIALATLSPGWERDYEASPAFHPWAASRASRRCRGCRTTATTCACAARCACAFEILSASSPIAPVRWSRWRTRRTRNPIR
jgi:peroxiredoxin Q/BCP